VADCSAEDKKITGHWKTPNQTQKPVSDGVNDAPVLTAADVELVTGRIADFTAASESADSQC